MNRNNSFIEYYDIIFSKKSYSEEIKYILKQWENNNSGRINNVLDLGCGTGNHALEIAGKGFKVTGLDIDPEMIGAAKKKLSGKEDKVEFIHADIAATDLKCKYEIIFSYFNVINYIERLEYLKIFFKAVHKHLTHNGLYLFDCWNGNATVIDPPSDKKIVTETDTGIAVKGTLKPEYDDLFNTATFKYNLQITDNQRIKEFIYELKQVYWNPFVLKELLKQAGFTTIEIYKHLSFDRNVTNRDYKICFLCRQ